MISASDLSSFRMTIGPRPTARTGRWAGRAPRCRIRTPRSTLAVSFGQIEGSTNVSGERQFPEWMRLGPAPTSTEGTVDGPAGGLDGAWRVWERLRGWDRRYAFVVDTVLAVGLFVVGVGRFVLTEHLPPTPGSWPRLPCP